nr:hypothetical protein [Tanacetum cinerariifolium]
MIVIDDHDMLDTGEALILRDMIETGEGLISRDVFDVREGSIPKDLQDLNIKSTEVQEQIDVSDNESYRYDPNFVPTPNGTSYWRLDLPEDEKPKLGDIFDTFDDGYNMYKVYSEKGRAGKLRSKFDINTLKEADANDEDKDGNTKRKRKTVSWVTNCLVKIGLKVIHGIECYKLFDFVENHNHPLMNENNMDLLRARRQLHFSDYIYIHRASLSNIGPTLAHRLKVALMGGYDKVRGTPDDYRDVIETGEGSIPTDVLDVGEGSNTRAYEEIDVSDNESYRYNPDFAPTPNGTPYWRPDLPEDEKPKLGDIFDTFDDGYNMYKVYSEKGRFNNRKSGIKRYKGKVTHRYVLCNNAGKVRSKFDINTLKEADADDEEKDDVSDNESYRYDPDFAPTPNGTLYWRPYLLEDEKPKLGDIFDTFDDGYNMYKVYSEKGRSYISVPIKSGSYGWLCKVRGTPGDYRNFKRAVNLFIEDRDAQMIVDKMINWKLHVPEFSFEHHVLHDELVSMFWADDTMKCNYAVFGDVVSFDATFRTKKYNFVFVPFTGIDHNQKCVTFDSYCWMLKAFLKVHQKQPTLALTDQDAALRNVVVIMFPDSKHRLCMWHITQKLPGKVLGDLDTDSEFRKEFHKLIWNVCIGPEVFEKHWNSLITREVQHEIYKGLYACSQISSHSEDRLVAEVHATIEDCVGLLRSNTDKLTQFLTTVKEMKKQLEVEMKSSNYDNNKEALYANLLGVTVPEQVVIKNPKKS